MKTLIIAEKPSLGEAIADALPGTKQKKGQTFFVGDYTIFCLSGHLLGLKMPEDYDERYKKWRAADLPIFFEPWEKRVLPDKPGNKWMSNEEKVNMLGDYLADADAVINAGDIDDEGSLLVNELLQWFDYQGPCYRLDTSDTSTDALKKALKQMKDNSTSLPGTEAAHARELGDMIFGINPTRYYSILFQEKYSFGRVQIPILGLVVNRDRQIEGHQKSYYYEMKADTKINGANVTANFSPSKDNPNLVDGKFLDSSYLDQKAKDIQGKTFPAVVKKSKELKKPPLPFNLTELNLFSERKFGYTPSQVMSITQSLREKYKAITYNRSDCQYLSENHWHEAPHTVPLVAANIGEDPARFNTKLHSDAFNDKNLTAHFAIIPTAEKVDVSKFTAQERNIYNAITTYYLIQFLPPAEYEKTTMTVDLGNGETLTASASVLASPGYLAFFKDDVEEGDVSGAEALSGIPAGNYDDLVVKCEVLKKETKAPSRYTQASLLKDTTRISKYVTDPTIKKALLDKDKGKKGENGSIGTPATRNAIIDKLIAVGYIEEKTAGKKKQLISTEKGRAFYDILPEEIKKADTTARWWLMQEEIRAGTMTADDLAHDVLSTIRKYVLDAEKPQGITPRSGGSAPGRKHIGVCPKCGKNVVETAKAFACEGRCGVTLWKDNKFLAAIGKKMTEPIAKELISTGKAKLKGCKSKKGNTFDCSLVCDFSKERPEFSLNFDKEVIGHCPDCGGNVFETPKTYQCENCKLSLWKETRYYSDTLKIPLAKAQKLYAGEKVPFNVTGKDGNTHSNKLKLAVVEYKGKKYLNLVRE